MPARAACSVSAAFLGTEEQPPPAAMAKGVQFSCGGSRPSGEKSSPVTKAQQGADAVSSPAGLPASGAPTSPQGRYAGKRGSLGLRWLCSPLGPRSPSTLCCQALARKLLGLAAVGPAWARSAVRCTGGCGKAARQARAAFSAHSSVPAQPHRLGRGGKGR